MTSKLNRRMVLGSSGAALALSFLGERKVRAEEASLAKPTTPLPPIEIFALTPLVDHIALSPNGQRVAVVSQRGDNKILFHFEVSDRTPKSQVLGPDKVRGLFWGDDSHVILVDSTTLSLAQLPGDKQELSQARNINVDTGKVITLFHNEEEFLSVVVGNLGRIKTSGGYRVTASNYRNTMQGNHSLFSFALDGSVNDLLCDAPADTENWVVAPDGYLPAYAEYESQTKDWVLKYNMGVPGKNNNFKEIYRTHAPLDSPDLVGLGRDGNSVVIEINAGNTGNQLHEIGANGVLGEPLIASGDRPHAPLFHPTTKRLAGFSVTDDWSTSSYFDPLMKALNEAKNNLLGDGYHCAMTSFSEDPRKMIVYSEGPDDAGTYYFVDFATGENVSIAVNYPELPKEWITQKKPILYKAADGLDIHGYLTLPPFKSPKSLPLVVLPHGGPQARDYASFDWQTQCLAAHGYAVLQPNYRGSSGYGKAFIEAGHGEWGHKMQTDLSDGVRWLVGQGIVDPKRVAIMGASYGGYAALAGATLDPGIYNCAVSIAGPSDLASMISFEDNRTGGMSDSSVVRYWHDVMGDPKKYDDVSPAKQAAKACCPILMIHGTDDTVVPIDQSQRMEKALKAAGKPVEFVTYKGQDHWETMESSRVAMMKAAMDFLVKYNPAT